jgi:hypothetical protein
MGIKASNLVIKSTGEVQEQKPVSTPAPVVKKEQPELNRLKGSKLVVDGKVKNISKKSAFLLDMLTLDDDQPK